jgi:hypothetical protein
MNNIILIIIIFIILYYFFKNNINKEPINKQKEEPINKQKEEFINNQKNEPINKQKEELFIYSWYPNTWIEKIDDKGEPIYNSRNDQFDTSSIPKTKININIEDPQGKTIKEIYDNSIINYKSITPTKNMITDETLDNIMPGGSNLQYYTADTWTYENEKQENGGLIYDNVYANDTLSDFVSIF